MMAVDPSAPMAGDVLDDRQHAAFEQPVARRSSKFRDATGLASVSPVADYRIRSGNGNVEHREAVDRDAEISEIVRNQPGAEPDRDLGLWVRQ
jgi:hypothetical protein